MPAYELLQLLPFIWLNLAKKSHLKTSSLFTEHLHKGALTSAQRHRALTALQALQTWLSFAFFSVVLSALKQLHFKKIQFFVVQQRAHLRLVRVSHIRSQENQQHSSECSDLSCLYPQKSPKLPFPTAPPPPLLPFSAQGHPSSSSHPRWEPCILCTNLVGFVF